MSNLNQTYRQDSFTEKLERAFEDKIKNAGKEDLLALLDQVKLHHRKFAYYDNFEKYERLNLRMIPNASQVDYSHTAGNFFERERKYKAAKDYDYAMAA